MTHSHASPQAHASPQVHASPTSSAAPSAPASPRWNRPLLAMCAAMAATAVVCLIGLAVDDRVLTAAPIWGKPFKFAVAFAFYTGTLAWMLSLFPRRSRVAAVVAVVLVIASATEMVIIIAQVIRGTTSHFNQSTALDTRLWSIMSQAAIVLVLATFVLAVVALRQPLVDRSAAYAIRLGLFLATLGMLFALPMGGPILGTTGDSHTVGRPDGGPGLPLLEWSTVAGDLRIGHFVGLHGLQAIPLLALLLTRFAGSRLSATARGRLVVVAGIAYALAATSLTWQALRTQPLIHPDVWTLSAWILLIGATTTAVVVVVARDRGPVPDQVLAGRNLG